MIEGYKKVYKVYILKDPSTNLIRYVGQTIRSLEKRLTAHLNRKASFHRATWINSLKNKSLIPIIELLEIHDSKEKCDESEIFFIKTFREIGYDLTNATSGGGGTKDYKVSDETKKKISIFNKGKKLSKEHIEKIIKSKTGRKRGPMSEECKKKIGNANRGKSKPPVTEEHRLNLSLALKKAYKEGRAHSPFSIKTEKND